MRLWLLLVAVSSTAVASPHRDIDGDGFDDATLDHRALYFGSAKGLVAAGGPATPRSPLLMFAVEVVGDVDGDGYADVVAGDPNCGDIATDMPACEIGSAYLFRGGPKRLAAKPDQTLTAKAKDTWFGGQIVALGDVDGDGFDDIALPAHDGNYVYRGTSKGLDDAPIVLPAGSIFPLGDVDHDGRSDLVIVTPQVATIYFGADAKHTAVVPLPAHASWYGTAGHGDFDGDGFDDLAISLEPEPPSSARVANEILIFRGSARGLAVKPVHRFTRDDPQAGLGATIASVGDLDGDHRDDLVIEAACSHRKGSNCLAGTAYVYLGGTRPGPALSPTRTNFSLASALVALGDVDGPSSGHR